MIYTILVFLILLSILVLAHEWGHYFSARKLKMKIEEFGLGYPPRIFSWKAKSGVVWSLNLIPIGGFVKLQGENGDDREDPNSFASKPIWKRFIVLFAGVFMNMVVAVVLFSISLSLGTSAIVEDYEGSARIENPEISITQVLEDSPAAKAGLHMGDQVSDVDDQGFETGAEIREYLSGLDENSVVDFVVIQEQEQVQISVVPEYVEQMDEIGLGVAIYDTGTVYYPWYLIPVRGVETTVWYTKQICIGFYGIFKSLITGNGVGVDVSGPIGIAVMTGEMAQMGFVYLLQFGAILSINLAILNILPIPALDGGRILFLIIEGIIRRPVNGKVEAIVHNIGFLLLMLLVVLITYKDILGLF